MYIIDGRKYKSKKDYVTAMRQRAKLWNGRLKNNKVYMVEVIKTADMWYKLGLKNFKMMIKQDVIKEDEFVDWLFDNGIIRELRKIK